MRLESVVSTDIDRFCLGLEPMPYTSNGSVCPSAKVGALLKRDFSIINSSYIYNKPRSARVQIRLRVPNRVPYQSEYVNIGTDIFSSG